MRFQKFFSVLTVISMLSGILTACGGNGGRELPTLAPTPTPKPGMEDNEPTKALDAGFQTIVELDGENENQGKLFTSVNGTLSTEKKAYAGEKAFCVSERTDAAQGVTLSFKNLKNEVTNVVGKKAYFSVWVYQESGKNADFVCSLRAKDADNVSCTLAKTVFPSVPSGVWTRIEALYEIPDNVKTPELLFIMNSSKDDFYFDELQLRYDPYSHVAAVTPGGSDGEGNLTPSASLDSSDEKKPLDNISFGFEDGVLLFGGRGDGRATIVSGGRESAKCMSVTGRRDYWHGAQLNLSGYELAGKEVRISFFVYHEESIPFSVLLKVQQTGSTDDSAVTIITAEDLHGGKWVRCTGTFTFDRNAEKASLFFEATDEHASFFIDDFVLEPVSQEM